MSIHKLRVEVIMLDEPLPTGNLTADEVARLGEVCL
jgi:ABC-type sugar transport system ATPase subunit